MSALRWWLLILGVVFFAGLAVWELRRPRQARSGELPPEPTRPREPVLELPEIHAHDPLASRVLPVVELPEEEPDPDEDLPALGAAPLPEPGAPEADDPGVDEYVIETPAAEAAADEPSEADFEAPAAEQGEPVAAAAPLVEWPPDDQRRIVALRLVAPQPERFAGRSLRQALAAEGFVLGRFDIFHKGDEMQRAVLSAASLSQPGTFDAETMDSQHFGGLSLFAVLPGPMSPPQAFEELVSTARSLNDRLCGVLQDEGGTPLTPARIASLRARLNSGAPA